MSNALQIYNDGGFDTMQRAAKAMVASGYFGDAKDIAKAIVKVMAGAELGIPPYASMTGIHVINSKPALGANLIATLIKSSGRYNYRVTKHTDDICTILFYEDGEMIGESTFTAQDAQRAGTKNMNKFPKNMLFSRAISNGARWHCPDIFGGAPTYTAEELGADVDEDGNILRVSEPPAHHATEYVDFVDMETVEPSHIQAQRLDTLPAPQRTPAATAPKRIMPSEIATSGLDDYAQHVSLGSPAPAQHWTETPPASPAAARDTIMANVPRYSENSHAAVNVVKKLLNGGRWEDMDKGERVKLLKAVEAHAAERDEQDAADAASVETPLSRLIAADAASAE